MYRLTIQWPRDSQQNINLYHLAGFSKTYTNRTDKKCVPVIIGWRVPGEGIYENTYVLCNKDALNKFLDELWKD